MRGTVSDLLVAAVLLGIVFSVTIFVYQVYSNFRTNSFFDTNSWTQNARMYTDAGFTSMNYAFIFLVMGFFLATVVSAWYIETHPIYFAVSLVLLIVFVSLSPILSNVFVGMAAQPGMSEAAAKFSLSVRIMDNLPIIMSVFGALILIALYAKMRSTNG